MDSLGKVAVDTGQILMIDPAYLFTRRQWQEEVIPMGKTMGKGRAGLNKAILTMLSNQNQEPRDLTQLAVIAGTGVGDGSFEVTRGDEGLKVHI